MLVRLLRTATGPRRAPATDRLRLVGTCPADARAGFATSVQLASGQERRLWCTEPREVGTSAASAGRIGDRPRYPPEPSQDSTSTSAVAVTTATPRATSVSMYSSALALRGYARYTSRLCPTATTVTTSTSSKKS